jgi:hypothetical protein
VENLWSIGVLSRTAGIDRGAFEYPIMADPTTVYMHEKGTTRAGAAAPYLESGPIELGDGEQIISLRQLVPDEATVAGQVLGSAQVTLYVALYPTANETTLGPFTLANPTSIRATGRQVRVRFTEVAAGDWRIGTPRLEGVARGRR